MINIEAPIALNTSTFVPLSISSLTRTMDAAFFTEDGEPLEIALDAAGTNATTIPTGQLNIPRLNSGEIACYVRAVSAAVNLGVILGRSQR